MRQTVPPGRAALVFLALAAGVAPGQARGALDRAAGRLSPDGELHDRARRQAPRGDRGRGEDRVILVWKTDELDKPPTAIGA